jgi:hypothetical protein
MPADEAKSNVRLTASMVAGWLCVIALAACGSLAVAHAGRPLRMVGGECRGSALSIRVLRSFYGGPIAGGYLSFTNRGNRRCTLSGWPYVRGIRRTGASSRAVNARTTQFGPTRPVVGVPKVVLRPGGHADAVFTADVWGSSPCGKPYRYLAVRAPESHKTVVLSAWINGLDQYLPACTRVHVLMIIPPSSLSRG